MAIISDLLTLDEVAELMRIGRRQLNRIIAEDPTFPLTHIGHKTPRVKYEYFIEWLDSRTTSFIKEK